MFVLEGFMPEPNASFQLVSLLQAGITADPLGRLLLGIVAVALVIIVGKFVLSLAWRLVTIAAVIVAILFVLSSIGLF